jgi:hypothetical protein
MKTDQGLLQDYIGKELDELSNFPNQQIQIVSIVVVHSSGIGCGIRQST